MNSFGCGSRVIQTDSIDQGIQICEILDRFATEVRKRDLLRSINYGHVFGPNRVCECGLSDIEYKLSELEMPDVCPIFDKNPKPRIVNVFTKKE